MSNLGASWYRGTPTRPGVRGSVGLWKGNKVPGFVAVLFYWFLQKPVCLQTCNPVNKHIKSNMYDIADIQVVYDMLDISDISDISYMSSISAISSMSDRQ
jgi:hypothetical protein